MKIQSSDASVPAPLKQEKAPKASPTRVRGLGLAREDAAARAHMVSASAGVSGNGASAGTPEAAHVGAQLKVSPKRAPEMLEQTRELNEAFVSSRRPPVPITNVLAQSPRLKSVLQEMLLFRDVAPQDFEQFYSLLHWRRVGEGTQLLTGGECSPWVFLLVEGTAKIHQENLSGTQVIFSICGTGEILGEMSALDGAGHSATVTMLESSLLGAITREEFVAFLLDVPQMSLNLSAVTARRLRSATDRIQSLARLDVVGRLAAQLLIFASHYGRPEGTPSTNGMPPANGSPNPVRASSKGSAQAASLQLVANEAAPLRSGAIHIDLHLRQSDLADLIGASRVRVNQSLHLLRRSGHIHLAQNRITLLDIDALRARCQ